MTTSRAYDIVDISSWLVMSQESRGDEPKDWVAPPHDALQRGESHWWMFKPVKIASYRRYDDWSEKLASELARLLGLPAAQVELARGVEDTGIISRNVTLDGWRLESGDTLLSELDDYAAISDPERRPSDRTGHNLDNIILVLDGHSGPPGTAVELWTAIEVFVGYLVFDAWIANTDRHAVNWAVVHADGGTGRCLAPSFDHGSALASGTQEPRLEAVDVGDFARRGFATRFENGRRTSLVDLALQAVVRVGGHAGIWLERLAVLDLDAVATTVERLPGMSVVRRSFLVSLLEINQRRLTQ